MHIQYLISLAGHGLYLSFIKSAKIYDLYFYISRQNQQDFFFFGYIATFVLCYDFSTILLSGNASVISGSNLFEEVKLREMEGFNRGPNFVEIKCGCTSRKYGDTTGTLRVYENGQFLISCQCAAECNKGK